MSCEISSVLDYHSDHLGSTTEEISVVCGAFLSCEWDWGTDWGQPKPQGIRQLHGMGKG